MVAINLIAFFTFCQQSNSVADSLIASLDRDLSDSVRLYHLAVIAQEFDSRPNELIYYASLMDSVGKRINDVRWQILARQHLSNAWQHKGYLNKSIKILYEALSLAESSNNTRKVGEIYGSIAQVFSENKELVKALSAEKKAIESFKRSPNPDESLCMAYLNLGYTYYELARYDSAIINYDLGLQVRPENFGWIDGYFVGNIALVKFMQGDAEEAEAGLLKAIVLLEPYDEQYAISDYMNKLAILYESKQQYSQAVAYAIKGVQLSKSLDLKSQVRDGANVLSRVYERLGKVDSALKYYKYYVSARDSIQNTESVKELANQQADYEISLKQAELDLANQQKSSRQNLAIALGIILFISIVFFAYVYVGSQKRKVLYRKLQDLDATKDKFFSIISHDLRGPISAFNGISSIIKGYLRKKSYDELEEMTDLIDKSAHSLSALLDNLLNWSVQQQGQVPYNPEPLYLKEIVDMTVEVFDSIAISKEIAISNEVNPEAYIKGDKNTVLTILRNLVGNAFKYTESGGKITIASNERDDMVNVSVQDTGVGMSQEMVDKLFELQAKKSTYGTKGEKGLGLGLQLVQEFVALNNGSISVESTEGVGTRFIVALPAVKIPGAVSRKELQAVDQA